MSSFALRGYRSSRQTLSRGFVPQYPYARRGGMRRLLKFALLGTGAYMIVKKLSNSNQSRQANSNAGSQPVQPKPGPQVGA